MQPDPFDRMFSFKSDFENWTTVSTGRIGAVHKFYFNGSHFRFFSGIYGERSRQAIDFPLSLDSSSRKYFVPPGAITFKGRGTLESNDAIVHSGPMNLLQLDTLFAEILFTYPVTSGGEKPPILQIRVHLEVILEQFYDFMHWNIE